MSFEETVDYLHEGEICVVCGKSVKPGDCLVRMHAGETRLPICCPLCFDAYQNDKEGYLQRHTKRILIQELRRSHKAGDSSSGTVNE